MSRRCSRILGADSVDNRNRAPLGRNRGLPRADFSCEGQIMDKAPMTLEGYNKLETELKRLKSE